MGSRHPEALCSQPQRSPTHDHPGHTPHAGASRKLEQNPGPRKSRPQGNAHNRPEVGSVSLLCSGVARGLDAREQAQVQHRKVTWQPLVGTEDRSCELQAVPYRGHPARAPVPTLPCPWCEDQGDIMPSHGRSPLVDLVQLCPQLPYLYLQPGALSSCLIQDSAGVSQLRLVQRLDATHLGRHGQGEPGGLATGPAQIPGDWHAEQEDDSWGHRDSLCCSPHRHSRGSPCQRGTGTSHPRSPLLCHGPSGTIISHKLQLLAQQRPVLETKGRGFSRNLEQHSSWMEPVPFPGGPATPGHAAP
ncbi:hypothetical protein P7K49_032879 [Saguinus oedipus]|uniref:Uncharacterized protein n=1 Tax=Saguinus oedipus TaxID=9490 RepID=A0ABQ9TQB0_SAGOE|nr:hypothetical protein P7K49_032879 [Saguinus oedipus]